MRRDIDQGRDMRVIAGLGDDRAAIAVGHQDGRTVLLVEDALGGGDVVGEAGQRLLHHGHVEAIPGQDVVDRLPAGGVDPGAVHQHDVLDRRGGGGRRDRGSDGGQQRRQQEDALAV